MVVGSAGHLGLEEVAIHFLGPTMRGAEVHRSLATWTGYDVVRVVLGLLLLTAAALKGHQLATEPTAGASLLNSRWFLIAVVEFELFFGLWLLAGLYPRWTWLAALLCFGGFAGVSLYKAISGEATCGCFGSVEVNPLYTFTLDVMVQLALVRWPPHAAESCGSPTRWLPHRRAAAVVVIWLILGVPLGASLSNYAAPTLAAAGVFDSGDFVVLEPEKWIGKTFPLVKYVDVGKRLIEGEWVVVLHRHDCPACQVELPRYEQLARDSGSQPDARRVMLLEIPPFADEGDPPRVSETSVVRGRLQDSRTWFVSTPVALLLEDGVTAGFLKSLAKTF